MTNTEAKVHVYTGNGKGKTTAALGLAMRACGHGKKVRFFQFMKGDSKTGENLIREKIPGFDISLLGQADFVDLENPSDEDRALARKGWMTAKGTLLSGEYDMVVLDELNVVLAAGLIELDQVFKVLSDRSPNTEVVITGRGAPRELVKRADLVTEMLAIKHYYQEGIAGREGIEW